MSDSASLLKMIESKASRNDILDAFRNIEAVTPQQADQFALLLSSVDDDFVRASIVSLLGRFGSDRHIQYILPLLDSEDHRIRANTIEALEALGDIQIINSVTKLLQDSSRRVRTNVIKFLQNKLDLNYDYLEKDFVTCPRCGNQMICAVCTSIEEVASTPKAPKEEAAEKRDDAELDEASILAQAEQILAGELGLDLTAPLVDKPAAEASGMELDDGGGISSPPISAQAPSPAAAPAFPAAPAPAPAFPPAYPADPSLNSDGATSSASKPAPPELTDAESEDEAFLKDIEKILNEG